jgi:hypothetical protein
LLCHEGRRALPETRMKGRKANERRSEGALEERIAWIVETTRLLAAGDCQAVQRAIDELDDEHLRSMIYVLLLARASDAEQVREWQRDEIARTAFEGLDGDDGPVLH